MQCTNLLARSVTERLYVVVSPELEVELEGEKRALASVEIVHGHESSSREKSASPVYCCARHFRIALFFFTMTFQDFADDGGAAPYGGGVGGIGSVEGDSQRERSDSGGSESSSSTSSVPGGESPSVSCDDDDEIAPRSVVVEEVRVSPPSAQKVEEVEGSISSESHPGLLRRSKRLARLKSVAKETRSTKKQRMQSDAESLSEDESSEWEEREVVRIINRRGTGEDREYRLVWSDGSLAWKKLSELEGCSILVRTYDLYLEKYPSKDISYSQFIARDVPTMQWMDANDQVGCAVHAVAMAFEMVGLKEEAERLQKLGSSFLMKLEAENVGVDVSTKSKGLRLKDVTRYLYEEVPKVGWTVDMKTFGKKNWFSGQGTGPWAIADLAISGKLPDGLFLVHAFKPCGSGHCVALQYKDDELVVREDGVTAGILDQKWICNVSFVRQLRLLPH